MTITKGAFPGGHWKDEPDAEIPVEIDGGGQELPEARRQVHLRQAQLGLPLGQRDPRRRARTTSGSRSTCRGRSPRPGSRCARRRSTRSPRSSSRAGAETVDVHVTPSNCVQCGAITAKGGRLTLPEGGDGPLYQEV